MAKHFAMIDKAKAMPLEDFKSEKLFLASMLVHCADLSNPAKPFPQAREWALRISQEFRNQVEAEEKRGLPVTPFMVGLEEEQKVYKQETGFIGFVVKPLWEAFNRIVEGQCDEQVANLEENLARYKELAG